MRGPLSIFESMTIRETEVTLAWARALARAPDPDATIREAMAALSDVLGMEVAVANHLVAADDEYEVSLVSGPEQIPVANLLGSRYAQASFERVISGRYERAPGVHLIPPDAPEWADFEGDELIPEIQPLPGAGHPWLPGQELFVVLRDREERVLTVISLDVRSTVSCRHPTGCCWPRSSPITPAPRSRRASPSRRTSARATRRMRSRASSRRSRRA